MRAFVSILVSVFSLFNLCHHAHAITSEKARIYRIDGQGFTRPRDCSAYGLGNDPVPAAFKYDYDDPLNHCDGVMNIFYYFKIVTFAAELEVSVLLRALKGISEVTWNAWAHYHPTATDTLGKLKAHPSRRQPKSQRTIRNKNIAIAFALTRLSAYVLPTAVDEATIVLAQLVGDSMSKYTAANTKSPQGIGNLVAQELIAALKQDGWNSEGSRSPGNAFPFADYTNYRPINNEYDITYPTRYQPLVETDKNGYFFKQFHITPQLRDPSVKPWGMKRSWIDGKKIAAPWGNGRPTQITGKNWEWYKSNVSFVLKTSASLTEKQKLIAEFFDNKIISFGGFERWFAHKNNWCHDDFVQYDQLSACLHDATILAWTQKMRIDAIRPASAIRYLRSKGVLPSRVRAWGGEKHGFKTAAIDPNDWQSYLRTMPHSEFPSGTSCVCQVWSDWTRLFQKGSDKLDLTLNWKPGCSSVEQGVTPKKATTHTFKTITEAHNTCIQSRVWAGVHFEASVKGGAKMCEGVAQQCYAKVKRLLKGDPRN